MIGSPPGYVGYDDGGQLTEQVRRRPYSVVLFDEIEKAHPDVFNLLLQILEDGTLTDSQGRKVDFRNTVVIMTSNVGATSILEPKRLGFTQESTVSDTKRMRADVNAALRDTFRPEFLNRIDEIIVFNPLTDEDIRRIAALMLAGITKRIAALNIKVHFTEDVLINLAREGLDPHFGARPLRRVIVRRIEDTFAEETLAGRIRSGDTVTAVWEDGVKYIRCAE